MSQDPATASTPSSLAITTFKYDVTPPVGHPLLAGLIDPVRRIDDPLEAIGAVIIGHGRPIVLCAVDWCAIANGAHAAWREALAEGAQTTPDRVQLHVVHQHNAPFVCLEAAKIVAAQPDLQGVVDSEFFNRCLHDSRGAVAASMPRAVPLTHIATGQARVNKIASNRRIVGSDGKIETWRGSSSTLALHRSLPDGLIDPWLKTVALFSGTRKVAALHFYATHPISYYGDGCVTSDFVGLARRHRQQDEPDCTHVYLTGCAGDVAAGRYNDGSPAARQALTERLYDAMRASERDLRPAPIRTIDYQTATVLPEARGGMTDAALETRIADRAATPAVRIFDAFDLAWRRRLAAQEPLPLSRLRVNDVTLLSLPAECFVHYQLQAQSIDASRFVAVAAYSDGGPWYVPIAEAYAQGGYEIDRALCAPAIEPKLTAAITTLLEPLRQSGDPEGVRAGDNRPGRSMTDALLGRIVSVASRGKASDEEVDFITRNVKAAVRLPRMATLDSGGVRVRSAGRSDVPRIQQVYRTLNDGHEFERKWTWLLNAMAPRLCIVAEDQSAGIVAFVFFYFNDRDVRERTVHEGFIGVLPEFQGRGIGTTMRRHAVAHFAGAGLAGMSTRITLSNTASLNPSLKLGFQIVDRYQDSHSAEERAYLRLTFPRG